MYKFSSTLFKANIISLQFKYPSNKRYPLQDWLFSITNISFLPLFFTETNLTNINTRRRKNIIIANENINVLINTRMERMRTRFVCIFCLRPLSWVFSCLFIFLKNCAYIYLYFSRMMMMMMTLKMILWKLNWMEALIIPQLIQ